MKQNVEKEDRPVSAQIDGVFNYRTCQKIEKHISTQFWKCFLWHKM